MSEAEAVEVPEPPSEKPVNKRKSRKPVQNSAEKPYNYKPRKPVTARKQSTRINTTVPHVKPSKRKPTGGKSPRKVLAEVAKANTAASGGIKKPHRFKPGTVALREIRKMQATTHTLIKKAPLYRLIREIMQDFHSDFRFQASALEAIHQACEAYIIDTFEVANLYAIHSKRVTILKKDFELVKRVKETHL